MENYFKENLKLKHRIQGVSNGLGEQIAETLEGALDTVTGKIIKLASKAEDTERLVRKRKYLEKQRAEIEKVLNEVYTDLGSAIEEKAVEVGQVTPELLHTIANQTLTIKFGEPHLDKKLVTSWFKSSQVEGLYFNEWLKKLKDSSVTRITKEARESIILNESLKGTAKRIENAMNVSRRGAQGLAQNAIFQCHNYAEVEYYKENRDIIGQLRFTATLDRRTTPMCIQLDQKIFKFEEVPVPPLHWRCRSMLSPVFREEALENIKTARTALQDTEARTVKHRDGTTSTKYEKLRVQTVPGKTTYSQWMQGLVTSSNPKDIAFAQEVLGPTRFKLVSSGKLKVESLYYHGKLRTIKELKDLMK